MDYEIIFYHSGKTAELENVLSGGLGQGFRQKNACAAADPNELAGSLIKELKLCRMIVIIGGLDGGIQSTDRILGDVLSPKNERDFDSRPLGKEGRLLRSGEQTIILLPDSATEIRSLLPELKKQLCGIYKIKEEEDTVADIDKVTEELDKNLAGTKRVRVAPTGMTAEKRNSRRQSALKATIAVLLVLAAAQLAAASYLFISQM